MSKSAGNTIPIFAEPDEIRRLVMSMVTDPQRIKRTDPGRPEVCNVCQLHRFFGDDYLQIQDGERTARTGCVETKQLLAERIIEFFRPMREKRAQLAADPGYVEQVLARGAEKVRPIVECHHGRGPSRDRHRSFSEVGMMSAQGPVVELGPRHRRWLLIFLVAGSLFFGVQLLQLGLDFMGGFSQIILIIFLAWLLAFVMSPDRALAGRPAADLATAGGGDRLRAGADRARFRGLLRRLLHHARGHPGDHRVPAHRRGHPDAPGGIPGRLRPAALPDRPGAALRVGAAAGRRSCRRDLRPGRGDCRRHAHHARIRRADPHPVALHADGQRSHLGQDQPCGSAPLQRRAGHPGAQRGPGVRRLPPRADPAGSLPGRAGRRWSASPSACPTCSSSARSPRSPC